LRAQNHHPFETQCPKFVAAGIKDFYVCPGTSSWNTLTGRTKNAIGNLRNAAVNGHATGAEGYLITGTPF
jgi:hexosaminidase